MAKASDYTSDQILEAINSALGERDFEAVRGLLGMLAAVDPHQAALIYDTITMMGETTDAR
jgi:hypothetical protein